MKYLIILAIFIVAGFIATGFAIFFEKRDFNKGKCRYCGKPLVLFGHDSQGCRGYICEQCSVPVWISYPCVDRKYLRWWEKK